MSSAVSPLPVAHVHGLQEFFEKFPQQDGTIILFNGYTGEAIYNVDRRGSPMPYVRSFSHWFEPTAQVQFAVGEESSSERVDMSKVRPASYCPFSWAESNVSDMGVQFS